MKNKKQFPSNFISTTRYSALSFLPLAILNQYRKLTNVYFLIILILSCFPAISPYSPLLQLLGVVFVLAVALIRDGIEDYYRYLSDQKSNSQPCKLIDPAKGPVNIPSADIVVGGLLWVRNEEELPADVVFIGGGIVTSDGGQPEAFV